MKKRKVPHTEDFFLIPPREGMSSAEETTVFVATLE